MKNVDLRFGIGDRLYQTLCRDCLDNLWNVGMAAVKACNKEIVIDIDEYSDGFVIDMFANEVHSYGWTFETLDECIALLTGMNAINEFNDEMQEYV